MVREKPKEKLQNRETYMNICPKLKFKGCRGGYWDSINMFGGLGARPGYSSVATNVSSGGHG